MQKKSFKKIPELSFKFSDLWRADYRIITTILIVLPLLIYAQVYDFPLLWDDESADMQGHMFHPFVLNPSLSSFERLFSEPYFGMYIPISYLFWGALKWFAELLSLPISSVLHLSNMGVHIVNGLLVFTILKQFVVNKWAVLIGVLFFLLHPIQVEVVAWISEFRSLLAFCFSLSALYVYLKKSGVVSLLSLFLFILAVLSKPSAVVLVLFVFVINYFHYGFKPWDNIRKTLPFALIALTIVLFTQSVQFGGNINFEQQHTLAYWQRPFAWLDSIVFYLYQLIYPYHLSASYTLFPKFIAQQAWFYPLALLPLGLGYWLWLKRKTSPMLVFSVALFVAGFFTTSGLVSFFFQQYSLVTDRYLYFAMLGVALLVASIFKSANKIKQGLIIGVLIVFAGLSAFRQIPLWQSEFALWSHSVRYELSEQYALENLNAVYANRAVSFHNKGNAFKIAGENEQAITYFTKAIDQYPKHFKNRLGMSFNSRGTLLFHQKKYEKSLSDFIQAVKLEPDNNDANVNKILLHSILKQCKQAYIALDFAGKNQVKLQKIRLADLQKRCPKNRPLP